MGSLLVEEADGTRFRLGNGFTDEERSAPPPVGTLVEFKHYGRTPNGIPRFASFTRRPETF
jgi:DNA ligase-1